MKLIKMPNIKKHGLSGHPIYQVWYGMNRRCYNKNCYSYRNYGGRGISVCDEWRNNVKIFADWAFKNGYKKELQIDRIDNYGNYEPSNCRFVTNKKNSRNRRTNHLVTYKGKTQCISAWADELNLPYKTIRNRIGKNKWSAKRAFTQPIQIHKTRNYMREFRIVDGIEEQKCGTCGVWKKATTECFYKKTRLPRGISPHCILCSKIYNNKQNKKRDRSKEIKKRQLERKRLISKNLECYCTKCERIHYKNLDCLWTGKLPAYFICDKCKSKEI